MPAPLRTLVCLGLLASPLLAAGADTPAWLPLPMDGISWDVAPSQAGLHDRAQIVVVTDSSKQQRPTPAETNVGYLYRRTFGITDSADMGFARLTISSNGNRIMAGKDSDTVRDLHGVSGSDLRGALVGEQWPAVLLYVDRHGLVRTVEAFTAEQKESSRALKSTMARIKTLDGEGIVPDRMQYPPDCQPGLDLLQVGDLSGCMKAMAKVGKPAAALGKEIQDRAGALAEADATALLDPATPAAERFIRGRRLLALASEMPPAAKAKGVSDALKAWKKDEAMKAEGAAWEDLRRTISALQMKKGDFAVLHGKVAEAHPGTYAAALSTALVAAAEGRGPVAVEVAAPAEAAAP